MIESIPGKVGLRRAWRCNRRREEQEKMCITKLGYEKDINVTLQDRHLLHLHRPSCPSSSFGYLKPRISLFLNLPSRHGSHTTVPHSLFTPLIQRPTPPEQTHRSLPQSRCRRPRRCARHLWTSPTRIRTLRPPIDRLPLIPPRPCRPAQSTCDSRPRTSNQATLSSSTIGSEAVRVHLAYGWRCLWR